MLVPAPISETVKPILRANSPPLVIGTQSGVRLIRLNLAGERIKTYRVPACSCPTTGSRSTRQISPRSTALENLATNRRCPIPSFDIGSIGIGIKVRQEFVEAVAATLSRSFNNLNDKDAVLDRHLRALAFGRTDLLGKCARHSQREAVAPSHKLGSHHPLQRSIYNVYP